MTLRHVSLSFLMVFLVTGSVSAQSFGNPARSEFDEYLAKVDASYSWRAEKTFESIALTTTVIKLKSQTWRSDEDVDRPLWEHWLVLTVPKKITTDHVFLLIGGGGHNSRPPDGSDSISSTIAIATGSIVAELKNVPNQPLVFNGDGKPRSEDDLIGYAWAQFLETGDATWLPRLPMVKSAMRAMDCITEFTASEAGGNLVMDKFVIAGGSKRGWTTWMTGVADSRVQAIVPIVIDAVNTGPSLRHHAEAYGFWADAIGNYYQHDILQRHDHPQMRKLHELVDPYYHLDRLTEPKYIVNASGDQFFLPDSSRFYYDQLNGEKLLRYVPNADHGLKNTDAIQSIAAYYRLISTGKPRPEYDWTFQDNGSIHATSKTSPSRVMLWQANNPQARDFRMKTIGAAFKGSELLPDAEGVYVTPMPEFKVGWTASFIEFTYDVGGPFPLIVTTAVRVTPDTLPFEGIDLMTTEYEPGAQKVKIEKTR